MTRRSHYSAAYLTRLLESHASFSFLRLGDGELQLMLNAQGQSEKRDKPRLRPSCELAYGDTGLTLANCERLATSYERCSFVDLYGDLPYNKAHLDRLAWRRAHNQIDVSSGTTGLLFEWMKNEFRSYIRRHSCIICGAEAALLEQLVRDPEYRRLASRFWPEGAQVVFLQPRNNGANLSRDIDQIKSDIKETLELNRADTVFLSLGGAAKILAFEIARESGVRALDFGSVLRALTFSGSDGHATWRASHHVHLVRVPFATYMRALQNAHPDFGPEWLVAKAHAQLCLELQTIRPFQSVTSDVSDSSLFDPSKENVKRFKEGLSCYRKIILPQVRADPAAMGLVKEFRYWRLKKGLCWDGRLFRLGVRLKSSMRRPYKLAFPWGFRARRVETRQNT